MGSLQTEIESKIAARRNIVARHTLEPSDVSLRIQIFGNCGDLVKKTCPWLFMRKQQEPTCHEQQASVLLRGTEIFPRTRHVGTKNFIQDLAERGWELVHMRAEERESPTHLGTQYCTVLFGFQYHLRLEKDVQDHLTDPNVTQRRLASLNLLKQLSDHGSWRVRGFRNPLPSDGEESLFGISLNYENFTLGFKKGPPPQRHLQFADNTLSIVSY